MNDFLRCKKIRHWTSDIFVLRRYLPFKKVRPPKCILKQLNFHFICTSYRLHKKHVWSCKMRQVIIWSSQWCHSTQFSKCWKEFHYYVLRLCAHVSSTKYMVYERWNLKIYKNCKPMAYIRLFNMVVRQPASDVCT